MPGSVLTKGKYIVATVKPWNIELYEKRVDSLPGEWTLVTKPADLTLDLVQEICPRYIFFPHWSWKVPDQILRETDCICFHMTDLPYGRGGSPLQNLIVAGHEQTMLTALRMTETLDEGPIYLKRPLELEGPAEAIYHRAAAMSFDMITEIVSTEPTPVPQSGEPTLFSRRTPEMSALPQDVELRQIYDHIRMLDAETYPTAFLDYGAYRLEFRGARLDGQSVVTNVTISRKDSQQKS